MKESNKGKKVSDFLGKRLFFKVVLLLLIAPWSAISGSIPLPNHDAKFGATAITCTEVNGYEAMIQPVQSGFWNQASTWPNGTLPTVDDDVIVPVGIDLKMLGTCNARNINVMGKLSAVNYQAGGAWINLTAESIMVMGGGVMEIGTAAQPYHADKNGQGIRCQITLTGAKVLDASERYKGIMVMGGGTLELHGKEKKSWTKLASTANVGANQIILQEDPSWEVGDLIALTSTALAGYEGNDWENVDQVEIASISQDGKTIGLASPLQYKHIGGSVSYTRPTDNKQWDVDIFGEVGLLSHYIKIQGDESDESQGFGGHIMVMKGSISHVENVELYKMGQKGIKGRYPFHWHMNEDKAQGSYIRNSSVHKSFSRVVTIHGTDSVTVDGIFAYDHIGHGIFLEDGGERFNTIKNNVVFVTRRPSAQDALTPSDHELNQAQNRTPASYWITNPNNYFENNIAAGTEGTGFWFVFPNDKPLFESGLNEHYQDQIPKEEPLGLFDGFTAHTCMNGFDIFDQLNDDHSIKPNHGWKIDEEQIIRNGMFYGNDQAIYCGLDAGGDPTKVVFENCVFSDNELVTMLAADIVQKNCLYNVNSELGVYEGLRSFFWFYDGPGMHIDGYFTGWDRSDASIVKPSDGVGATTHINPTFHNCTSDSPGILPFKFVDFSPTHRVRNASLFFKDYEGGFTGKANTTIIPEYDLFLDGHEYQHPSWVNAYRSDYFFSLDYLYFDGTLPPDIHVERVKPGTENAFGFCFDNDHHAQIPVITDQDFIYNYYFQSLPEINKILLITFRAEQNSSYITCFKNFGLLDGLSVNKSTNAPSTPAEVNSLQALKNSTSEAFYLDVNGDLYIKRIFFLDQPNARQHLTITWDGIGAYTKPLLTAPQLTDSDGDSVSDRDEMESCREPNDASDMNFGFKKNDERFDKFNIAASTTANPEIWLLRTDFESDPYIARDGFSFSGNQVSQLMIRIKSEAAGSFQLFWKNSQTTSYAQERSVVVTPGATNVFEELVFDMSGFDSWMGKTITSLRLDFPPSPSGSSHTFIDYIHGPSISTGPCVYPPQNDFVFSLPTGPNNSTSVANEQRWYEADENGNTLTSEYPTWINSFSPFDATIPAVDTVYLDAVMAIASNGRLTNNGVLVIKNGGSLSMDQTGRFINNGEIIVEEGGSLDNGSGGDVIITSYSSFSLHGSLSILQDPAGSFILEPHSNMVIGTNAVFDLSMQ